MPVIHRPSPSGRGVASTGSNLRHNPRVVLTTGCNEWERGTDVVVEGTLGKEVGGRWLVLSPK